MNQSTTVSSTLSLTSHLINKWIALSHPRLVLCPVLRGFGAGLLPPFVCSMSIPHTPSFPPLSLRGLLLLAAASAPRLPLQALCTEYLGVCVFVSKRKCIPQNRAPVRQSQ